MKIYPRFLPLHLLGRILLYWTSLNGKYKLDPGRNLACLKCSSRLGTFINALEAFRRYNGKLRPLLQTESVGTVTDNLVTDEKDKEVIVESKSTVVEKESLTVPPVKKNSKVELLKKASMTEEFHRTPR